MKRWLLRVYCELWRGYHRWRFPPGGIECRVCGYVLVPEDLK